MEKILFLVAFLVSAATAGKNDPAQLPPKLLNEGEIFVWDGTEVSLTCEGNRPIVWTFENYDGTTKDLGKGELVAPQTVGYKQASSLTIKVDNGYQGLYHCHYEGANVNDSNQSDSTYVYLFASEEDFADIPLAPEHIFYNAGDDILLDCRVTRPNITVLITHKEKTIHDGPLEDPRKGYYIRNANATKTSDEFNCKIKTGTGKTSDKQFIVKEKLKLQAPWVTLRINTNSVGCDMEVVCMFLNRSYIKAPEFTWNYPDHVDDDRVSTTRSDGPDEKYNSTFFKSYLKVHNVTLEDSGNYECKVSLADYSVNEESIDISIQDGVKCNAAAITTGNLILFFSVLVVVFSQYFKL